jgi:CheY-like chemotaxis protein
LSKVLRGRHRPGFGAYGIVVGIENVLSNSLEDGVRKSLLMLQSQSIRSLSRLNNLAKNLIFGSAQSINKMEVSFLEIFEKAVEEIRESHSEYGSKIILIIPGDCKVVVDCEKMIRVFVNIMANAIEASFHGDVVGVEVYHYNETLKISFCNLGEEISNSEMARFFEIGFSRKKSGGLGVGLAMVKRIVELHGSKVICSSEKLMKNDKLYGNLNRDCWITKFSFHLNAANVGKEYITINYDLGEKMAPINDKEQEILNGSFRILAIDDDEEYLFNLVEILKSIAKLSVVRTSLNPVDGLSVASEFCPDLVILDMNYGTTGLDGYWFLDRFVHNSQLTKVIVHSSFLDEHLMDRVKSEGTFEFVPKPMSNRSLLEILKNINLNRNFRTVDPDLPLMCVVDDEPHTVGQYFEFIKDAQVYFFSNPNQFLDFLEQNADRAKKVQVVLSDYYFEGFNASEIKFVRATRRSGFAGPIVLFSNVPLTQDLGNEFTLKIEKSPVSSLKSLLEKLKRHS